MNPLISVVIPAHNEEQYLGETLRAVRAQTYPYYEIIVVANGCTDNTVELARQHGARVVDLPERGLGKARNTGGAKARGQLLVFLDADTQLGPQALEMIIQGFTAAHSSATLKGQPDTPRLTYSILYAFKNLLHRCSLHCGSSGVICCWRDQFKEVSGFDEALNVRENSDLISRLKRFGPYTFISQATAVTSMRRYERVGAAKGFWQWVKIWWHSIISDLHHRSYEPIR